MLNAVNGFDTRNLKKGQQVFLIASWDNKGTCYYKQLTVHSCGKKQMVLVDETGAKFEGKNFYHQYTNSSHGSLVIPCTSVSDIAALAQEFAENYRAKEIEFFTHRYDSRKPLTASDQAFEDRVIAEKTAMKPRGASYEQVKAESDARYEACQKLAAETGRNFYQLLREAR